MSEATAENPPRPQRLQFSLMTLLVVVLVASAVFGLIGRQVYWGRIEAARANNLKMIGIALHNYHTVWNCFPPASVSDQNGRPMHSWRVLLLPFLEYVDLYDKYDFNEPWNGPNNSALAGAMPDCYRSPLAGGAEKDQTVYVAVVGDNSMWPGASGRRLRDVPDGLSNTVQLLETIHAPVPWMEPTDAEYEATLARIRQECRRNSDELDLSRYRTLFADGSVQTIHSPVPYDEVEWYFQLDDGWLPTWK